MQNRSLPLVFLHGFLGSPADWDEVISFLPHRTCIAHSGYEEPLPARCHLIGYSMGGRVAMGLAARFPEQVASLIAISAHPGLRSEQERQERAVRDAAWAEKLRTLPIDEFLKQWYDQPLFANLRNKEKVLSMRKTSFSKQNGALLLKYSLAHQPVYKLLIPHLFLVGEYDTAYRALLPDAEVIPGAGHALHLENPKETAAAIARMHP